jgi:hypothetical protein
LPRQFQLLPATPELGCYSRELLVDVCQLNRLGKILQRAFNWDAGKRLGAELDHVLLGAFQDHRSQS